jgi:hypothetical protein
MKKIKKRKCPSQTAAAKPGPDESAETDGEIDMEPETISTSADELFSILKASVDALAPILISAKLIDPDLSGYDGWDSIIESLFDAIVTDTILASLELSDQFLFKLPAYGFHVESYKECSFIQVISKDPKFAGKKLPLVSLKRPRRVSGRPKM